MAVKPSTRRSVTITDHQSSTTSFGPAKVGNLPSSQKDLHPLPAVHLDAQDVTPQGLQKKFMDVYEALRTRTDAMAKNPDTAPAFERRIAFTNSNNHSARVTVTFPHSLGRAPVWVTCNHSENAFYQGFSVPNPNGEDPATHHTIACQVPANTTAYHSFKLTSN